MKQYSLRYLYSHLGLAMNDLPFEITNYNKVIAEVRGVGVKNVMGVSGGPKEEKFDNKDIKILPKPNTFSALEEDEMRRGAFNR